MDWIDGMRFYGTAGFVLFLLVLGALTKLYADKAGKLPPGPERLSDGVLWLLLAAFVAGSLGWGIEWLHPKTLRVFIANGGAVPAALLIADNEYEFGPKSTADFSVRGTSGDSEIRVRIGQAVVLSETGGLGVLLVNATDDWMVDAEHVAYYDEDSARRIQGVLDKDPEVPVLPGTRTGERSFTGRGITRMASTAKGCVVYGFEEPVPRQISGPDDRAHWKLHLMKP